MVFEQLVDEFHDLGFRPDLLGGGLGIQRRERLGLAPFKANVDLGDAFSRELEECHVLDDMGEHALSLAVRRGRVRPEFLEVCGQRAEPFADRLVENEPVLPSCPLSVVTCLGQGAQLVIPISLERVGDQAITRIDHHKPALRQICFDLSSLDGTTSQLVGLRLSSFDLLSDVQRQLDGRGGHPFGHPPPDRLVDGVAGDRLAAGRGLLAIRTITNVPGLQPAAQGFVLVLDAEVLPAHSADRTSLQERRALPRGRTARELVSSPIAFQDAQILLILVPRDVARMSVGKASDPIARLGPAFDFLPLRRAAITSPPVGVNARIARVVQGAHGGRRRQRSEDHLPGVVVVARGKAQALAPKSLNRLVGGADAGEGLEKVDDAFSHLLVGVEHHVAGLVIHQAGGQQATVLSASRLVQQPPAQPRF